jgi:hypothetical protein
MSSAKRRGWGRSFEGEGSYGMSWRSYELAMRELEAGKGYCRWPH